MPCAIQRYYTESDVAYPFSSPPSYVTPDAFEALHAVSPMPHLDDHDGAGGPGSRFPPTVIFVGGSDMRVSSTQGKAWYHALRTRGFKTAIYEFPGESHALDSVAATLRVWEATLDWFRSSQSEAND
jgi:acetyl esterase/lipase